MIAEGLHDRSRSRQTFPASDSDQFKQGSAAKVNQESKGVLVGMNLAIDEDINVEPSLHQQLREQDAAEAARKLHSYENHEDEPAMDM